MKILVTNDDGINASGIAKLAEVAKRLGEVYVVAPSEQCSAMSHKISILKDITLKEIKDFPVNVSKAYSVGGTPADCIKIALEHIMPEKPDIVLSGINKGYNAGIDIEYSGTVAAAMEALMKRVPAIAVSLYYEAGYELVDEKLYDILAKLIDEPPGKGKIWNVNFPGCTPAECKGILYDRVIAKTEIIPDKYVVKEENDEEKILVLDGSPVSDFEEDTDLYALVNGYISIGTVTNMIMG